MLLDEAFDGLDPTMRSIVKRMLIDAMLDRKLTVVFSSHNMAGMDEFSCDDTRHTSACFKAQQLYVIKIRLCHSAVKRCLELHYASV